MHYLVTNPHNAPVVLRNRDAVRDCIQDDYYTAFNGSGGIPGLAEWTATLPVAGGTFTLPDGGEIAVRPTLRRAAA